MTRWSHMTRGGWLRRTMSACAVGALLASPAAPLAPPSAAAVPPSAAAVPSSAALGAGAADPVEAPLTNLGHLDYLRAAVAPPAQALHTTYRLEQEPQVGVVWTYAEPVPDGPYRRLGGGRYDPATGRYSQGAFNADDIARAAVVYIRHWQATGTSSSRTAGYQLLRGLTYLQTSGGPNAGNVVLWMQPDGVLNPSADPPDSPAPSDSADSYWLARTVWALGEGYAVFRGTDPAFASFLRARLGLALDAVERGPLARYGRWLDIDGVPTPAWLIAEGSDATGEALLGLAAFVAATGDARARRVLARLADGVAAMRAGDPDEWPYGAILPWARSRAMWHAWAGLAPAGLAAAARVGPPVPGHGTGGARWLAAAATDASSFTSHLLVAGGPDNGWLPAPVDRVQIAYGAQSRVESLLRVADATDRPGLADLAGVAAAWFLGANPAATPMYDPATGRTFDGVTADGVVNRNSGAESTIHGLLTTLALDARPRTKAIAATATVSGRHTARLVEAESGVLAGDAALYRPASAWTGESQWSGGAGVRLGQGGTLRLSLPAGPSAGLPVGSSVGLPVGRSAGSTGGDGRVGVLARPAPANTAPANTALARDALLMPVVRLEPGAGVTTWRATATTAGSATTGSATDGWAVAGSAAVGGLAAVDEANGGILGVVRHGAVGGQGESPAPGLLSVRTLGVGGRGVAGGAATVTAVASGAPVLIDAVLVQPRVEWLALTDARSRGCLLVRSFATRTVSVRLAVPGDATATVTVEAYDPVGRLVLRRVERGDIADVTVPAGGFVLARRGR